MTVCKVCVRTEGFVFSKLFIWPSRRKVWLRRFFCSGEKNAARENKKRTNRRGEKKEEPTCPRSQELLNKEWRNWVLRIRTVRQKAERLRLIDLHHASAEKFTVELLRKNWQSFVLVFLCAEERGFAMRRLVVGKWQRKFSYFC